MVGNIRHNAGITITVGRTSINMDMVMFISLITEVCWHRNIFRGNQKSGYLNGGGSDIRVIGYMLISLFI